MTSQRLEALRAQRRAQAEAPALDSNTPADTGALEVDLVTARAAADAANKAVQERRELIAHINDQIEENVAAVAKAKAAATKAVLARKTPAPQPTDLRDALETAKAEASSKLPELEAAAARANGVLRQAEAAVAAKVAADRKAQLVSDMNQAVAPHLAAVKKALEQFGLEVPVGQSTFGELAFERVAPTAPKNAAVAITDPREVLRRKIAGLDLQDAKHKLTFVPGCEGYTTLMLKIEIAREPALEAADVLRPEQLEAHDAEMLAGAAVKRAATKTAADEKRAAEKLEGEQRSQRWWRKHEVGTGSRVGSAAK